MSMLNSNTRIREGANKKRCVEHIFFYLGYLVCIIKKGGSLNLKKFKLIMKKFTKAFASDICIIFFKSEERMLFM